jgi:hypothetical protein
MKTKNSKSKFFLSFTGSRELAEVPVLSFKTLKGRHITARGEAPRYNNIVSQSPERAEYCG